MKSERDAKPKEYRKKTFCGSIKTAAEGLSCFDDVSGRSYPDFLELCARIHSGAVHFGDGGLCVKMLKNRIKARGSQTCISATTQKLLLSLPGEAAA